MTDTLNDSEKEALLKLLDDPSRVVREALRSRFAALGEAGQTVLEDARGTADRSTAEHAELLLREVFGDDSRERFRAFIRSFHYELETGYLLLGKTVYPHYSTAECCRFMDRAAARARQLILTPGTAWEACRVLNRVLFHELEFRGDAESFHDPRNSFLHLVLDRRRGLPITLSVIYLLVAGRCGIQVEPIGYPGRFMVGCFIDEEPFYIDPFEHGRFRSREDLAAMLEERGMAPEPAFFLPVTVGETLMRCCRNLIHNYQQTDERPLARLFSGFLHEFESAYRNHI